MKKVGLLFLTVLSLLLTGCSGTKPYVDVTSQEYATLQLVYKGDVPGSYSAYIDDISKGCKKLVSLGRVGVDKNTRTETVKIPVEVPLLIGAYYVEQFMYDSYTDGSRFVLKPEKNKHYVVSYMRKDLDFFNAISNFDVYVAEGDKKMDVPSSRLRDFDATTECR